MTDGSRLVMSQGPQPGQTFLLDRDVLTIGRDPGNDITIDDGQISRQHARITRQGGFLILEDIGSTNGTFVNGMRLVASHTLANGDVVGMGDAVALTFYGSGASATETVIGAPPVRPAFTPPTRGPQPRASQPRPAYVAPAAPTVAPPTAVGQPQRRSKTWWTIGCAVLLLVTLMACVGVFVLDYLQVLPPVFYEPLRWLGFF